VEDGVIWYRKLSHQMTLTTQLMSAGVDDVIRDVTGRQDDLRKLMAFYVISVGAMLFLLLPVIVTSALGTTNNVGTTNSLVVYARTMQVRSYETKLEKRKTERLLHEMLPKSVAYRLRKGEQVRDLIPGAIRITQCYLPPYTSEHTPP